ncbi:MAG TPA: hypothetical protein VN253_28440 [Kofleriaceae bacterium]|nr:hypothetical protein [Kofleriaceae bacterium]
MRARAAIVLASLSLLAACASEPLAEAVYTVERVEQRVLVRGALGDEELLRAGFEAQAAGIAVDVRSPAGAFAIFVEQPARLYPTGWARDAGGAGLELAGSASAWRGQYAGRTFELSTATDREALAAELGAAPLGDVLRELVPFHAKVRALMAETRSVFTVAALADAALGFEPGAWPRHVDALDLEPPGMLAGDQPGLGMTCATSIRCAGDAPICVTEDHQQTFGFCSRTCLDDGDCGDGAVCGLMVGDVPGVSGELRMCYVPCPGSCPRLLQCVGRFGAPAASVCGPVQR